VKIKNVIENASRRFIPRIGEGGYNKTSHRINVLGKKDVG